MDEQKEEEASLAKKNTDVQQQMTNLQTKLEHMEQQQNMLHMQLITPYYIQTMQQQSVISRLR